MDVSKFYKKAEEAIKKKNYDLAIVMLKDQVLKYKPTEVDARKLLRAAVITKYDNSGYPSQIDAIVKGLGPRIKMFIGKMTKNWNMTIEEAENFLVLDPKNVSVLYALGEACVEAKYIDTAISVFENIISLKNDHLASYKKLGKIYEEHKQDFQSALNYYQKATRIDRSDQEAGRKVKEISANITSSEYGKAKSSRDLIRDKETAKDLEEEQAVLRTDEDIKKAIQRTKKKIQEEPEQKKGYRRLGELYQKLQKYSEAIAAYQKFLELDPTSFDIKCRVSDCKITQAEQNLQAVKAQLQENPDDPTLKQKLKKLKSQKAKIEIEEYRMQIQEQPTNKDTRFKLGQALFRGGQYDDAIENFQFVAKDPRNQIAALNYMGHAFIKKKEFPLAEEQFKHALELQSNKDPKYRDTLYNLGLAYEAAGKKQKAIDTFTDIYKVDIRYRDVADRLKKLKGA